MNWHWPPSPNRPMALLASCITERRNLDTIAEGRLARHGGARSRASCSAHLTVATQHICLLGVTFSSHVATVPSHKLAECSCTFTQECIGGTALGYALPALPGPCHGPCGAGPLKMDDRASSIEFARLAALERPQGRRRPDHG